MNYSRPTHGLKLANAFGVISANLAKSHLRIKYRALSSPMFFAITWPNRTIRICFALVFCALCLNRVSAQQPPPSTPAKAPKGSIIRGRVVYADTGRPLRRAEVSLLAQENQNWIDVKVSDRSGEFVFRNISAGRYLVLVNAPDIVSPLENRATLGSLNLKIALGQIEDGFSEVTVDGRSSVKTEIRASRGGVITGRVLSESDEPIAKAQIRLFEIKNGKVRPVGATQSSLERDQWRFQTDSRGIYRIAGLATGEYVVRASESDEGGDPDDASEGSYTNGSMMVAFHPKALRLQDATSVKVQLGVETSGVDIRFTDRVPHRISGTVFVRGKAASGAEIRLIRDEREVEIYRYPSTQARTDTNGYWEIRAVPDGNYTLSISGNYNYISIGDTGNVGGYGVMVTPLSRELTVAGGDITDLKLELVEGGTLNGVVSVEGGTPLPERLMIELVPQDLRSANTAAGGEDGKPSEAPDTGNAVSNAFVNENGAFSITRLPAGSFHFRFAELGTRHYVKSITLKDKDLLRNPVTIERGKSLDGVRIVLSSELVSVSARAVERSDRSKPLNDAAVLLLPAEPERRRIDVTPIAVRTDKEGRFTIKAAPGEYFVVVFDRRRKNVPIVMPTETSLIKNASTLQKINFQRTDEKKVVEVVGP